MKQNEEILAGEESNSVQPAFLNNFSKIILIAIWFGLLTGLIEGAFLIGWRQYFRDTVVHLSPHALWMAPLTEMLIFIILGVFLSLLAKLVPRFFTIRTIIFFFSVLSFLALLLMFPQLHIYVKWILTVGLAVQTSRIVSKYQNGFYQVVRRTAPLLIIVVSGLLLGTFGWEKYSERQALAKLPPPPSSTSPNVIVITLDTVRAQSLSLYGYERKTSPQLEKIGQESVVFDEAIATASWTLPSHASIFTGRFPHELTLGVRKPFKTTYPTLAEELDDRGYQTAGFVANFSFCTKAYGLNKGMIHYEDYPVSLGQMILSSTLGQEISNIGFVRRALNYHEILDRKNAEVINEDFLKWEASRDQSRPFFAFLNYFDAHEPLLPPQPFDGMFGDIHPNGNFNYHVVDIDYPNKHQWGAEDAAKYRNAYDSSIAYLDEQLGVLYKKLSERGILDNTIVIITSDHGELLGEHGLYSHGNSLYINSIRVPLLIRYPGQVSKGVRIDEPISLRDIPATVLDLIGEREGENPFPGQSLSRYWNKTTNVSNPENNQMILSELKEQSWKESWYPISKGDIRSLISDHYHYIFNEDGSEELYDRKADPKEQYNLAQNAEEEKTMEEFRTELKKISESR